MASESLGGSTELAAFEPPVLRQSDITDALEVARQAWLLTDLTDIQRERLQTVTVTIDNLEGSLLGLAGSREIVLDDDAAGFGWSTDADDVTAGQFDLLTVLAHELGHIIGYGDLDPNLVESDIMRAQLQTGHRESALGDLDNFFGQATKETLPFE
jgi:hypothetical protein